MKGCLFCNHTSVDHDAKPCVDCNETDGIYGSEHESKVRSKHVDPSPIDVLTMRIEHLELGLQAVTVGLQTLTERLIDIGYITKERS